MKINRIMIAAPKSGSGKTLLTCALLKALKKKGEQVVSYKCGPDYIDPMFHERVLGIPSKNLDTFFTDAGVTRELFLKNREEKDFAVIEGVMGLFDGLGGIREEGSSYHLARVTKTPIILVADVKGMGRSMIPMLAGFLAYDKEHLIEGIILNRMSEAYYQMLKPLIETELKVRVLGYFPIQKDICIESRHLGLVLPDEVADIEKQLELASETLEKTVDTEAVRRIAEQAAELKDTAFKEHKDGCPAPCGGDKAVIGVARDEAFCFYYEDNLLLLQEMGAELVAFSPLHDEELPEDCDALLLGGGYPELYAGGLEENVRMRNAVKEAFQKGMPVVAECGGFMYLHDAIADKEGVSHKMAGVLPFLCSYQGRSVRFGYIELEEKKGSFLPEGERIKGHEFHYYDSTGSGEDCRAVKPVTGKTYPCVLAGESYWLGFPHLYYPSNPIFAENFVKKAQKYRREKGGSVNGKFTSFF